MRKAVYIQRKLTKAEAARIKSFFREGSIIFYHPDWAPDNETRIFGKAHKLNEAQTKGVNFETLQKLMNFGNHKVNDTSVLNLLQWESANIFFYQRFRIYFEFRNGFYRRKEIDLLLEKFDHLLVYSNIEDRFKPLTGNAEFKKGIIKKDKQRGQKLAFSSVFLFRGMMGLFKLSKVKKKDILILDRPENYQVTLDLNTLEKKKSNPFLGYLFAKHSEHFTISEELLNPTLREKKKNYFEYLGAQNSSAIFGETIFFRALLNPFNWSKIKKVQKKFSNNIQLLKKELTDPFDLELVKRLEQLSGSNKFFLFRYLAWSKYLKKKTNLKTLATADENSPYQKCILDAARQNGIKTVGIQHGSMHLLHPAYRYSPKEHKQGAVPDLTLTWGTNWQEFLIKEGNFSKEKIGLTGQLRTDIIPKLLEQHSTKVADNQSFRIIYASQPIRDEQLRIKSCEDVFNAIEGLKNVELIIKPHPKETDLTFFSDIAKRLNFSANWKIESQSDLYQLISQCDAMIVCFSTVGVETIYFSKPLIVLDHLQQDILDFIKDGVGFEATDATTLRQKIVDLQSGKLKLNQKACEAYIEKKAYKIDGQVADRVLAYLKNETA